MKYYVILLFIAFVCSAFYQSVPLIMSNTTNSKITEIVHFLDSLDGFSGAVLIAKDDRVLVKKTYGYAHLGHRVKNEPYTKFNQGSIGKTFTALAILQLLQQNKLALTDKVGQYLLNYPNSAVSDSVTIHHLLTHTSGVPHYFARETFLNASKDLYRSMDDLAPLYENEPMETAPGEMFSYRNTNYVLLGRIIEQISGLAYDDYLEQHIYPTASMTNTGNFDLDHPIPHAAEGYTTSEVYPNKLKSNIHTYPSKGSAAGGGYTTLDDLFNFTLALKNHQLLDKTHTQLFTTPISSKEHYGYGMQFPTPEKGDIYGHSGGHFGVGVEWRVYEKESYTVVLLTNKDTDKGFLEARFFIQKILSGNTSSIERFFNTKAIFSVYNKHGYAGGLDQLNSTKGQVNEFDFIMKGYDAIKKRDYNTAIDLFQLGIVAFPESADLFDSLGEAHMKAKHPKKAIEYYTKSLELDSDNENAKEMLHELSNMDKAEK